MGNIINYVDQEKRTFEEKPFCRVDSLILSQLAYIELDSIFDKYIKNHKRSKVKLLGYWNWVVSLFNNSELSKFTKLSIYDLFKSEYFDEMFGNVFTAENTKKLFISVASSPRFRDLKLGFYVNENDDEIEKQFSAITYILNDTFAYIAYRGTDTSIIGWKEDFNMAYLYPVPAQISAYKYLDKVAKFLPDKLIVGGHSKGGNLAIYSVMKCDEKVRARVEYCFNHDGPGFREKLVQSDEFKKVAPKIVKTVPEDSIIGMLMHDNENYQVIKSNEVLFGQHDAFTWEVDKFEFIDVKDISKLSKYAKLTISQWIENMSDEKAKIFVDQLFNLLLASNFTTFTNMKRNWKKSIPAIYKAIGKMDDDTKKVIKNAFEDLASIGLNNL